MLRLEVTKRLRGRKEKGGTSSKLEEDDVDAHFKHGNTYSVPQ